MKSVLIAAAATALLSTQALAEDEYSAAKFAAQFLANCQAEWPDDEAKQVDCFTSYIDGLMEWSDLVGQPPFHNRVAGISKRCFNKWPGKIEGYNWPKVAECTRQKLDAYGPFS